MRRLIKTVLIIFVIFLGLSFNVYAESKITDFVFQEKNEDLQVLFTFDKEIVDIEFISPSGKVFNKSNTIYEYDNFWASYRIVDAEVGQWKVKYDKKSNEAINYSIADNNQGLWAEYFNINEIYDDKINVSFSVENGSDNDEYNYEINLFNKIASNSTIIYENIGISGKDINVDINMNNISSGEYSLILNAWKGWGSAEIFDSIETETFIFDNPFEPEPIDNFSISVQPNNHKLYVSFLNNIPKGINNLKVTFFENNKYMTSNEYENDKKSIVHIYDGSTNNIRVDVQYKYINDVIWSKRSSKTISLDENWLEIDNDIKNSKTLTLKYKTKNKSKINIYNELSNENTNLDVIGDGNYLIDLLDGNNSITAIMTLDDSINYTVYDNYYYNGLTPTIRLFENINGKTFNSNKISIIGEVKNADSVLINSKEVELNDGIFDVEVILNPGENIFELQASKNGKESKMIVKVNKRTTSFDILPTSDFKFVINKYIPLFISLFISFVISIILLFKIEKSDKGTSKINRGDILINTILLFLLLIIEVFLFVLYFKRLNYSNSIEFLDVIEKSINNAEIYIINNNKILTAIIFVGILIIINIIIIVAKKIIKKKN